MVRPRPSVLGDGVSRVGQQLAHLVELVDVDADPV